jgi:imidazolonepropionase-like amidohydrolase
MPVLPLAALLVACAAAVPSSESETATLFVNMHLITGNGPEIERGVIVVQDGLILAAGAVGEVSIPLGARVVNLAGKVVMPGLVDTHSHIGEPFGADDSHPIQPEVRNLDGINVRSSTIQRAQAGGITTANLMSGSGHLMSGQTTYIKLRDGRTIDDLVYRRPDGRAMGGLKMANGTNSQDDPPFPGTRGKSAALVRGAFVKAQEYAAKIERANGDASKLPDRDLGLETLVEVLNGERVVHHHTHRHDDIMTVLRLREEFGFRLVLQHASEAYKVADEIAAAGVPCSLILIDSPGGKIEAIDMSWKTGGVLERAGVSVAYHTDDWVNDSRLFRRSAALGQRAGLSRAGALRSLTLSGAEMLDLDDRIGSLEPGKDADFIVLSGDPLSIYSMVEQTWIDGVLVFDISREEDRLASYGGEGASYGGAAFQHSCLTEVQR